MTMFSLIPYITNIIMSTYNQYKIINEIFYFFSYQLFKIWYAFYTYNMSQFELTTFQVLKSCMQLVATILAAVTSEETEAQRV